MPLMHLDDGLSMTPAKASRWTTVLANEASTTATRTSDPVSHPKPRSATLVVVTANKDGTTATYTPSIEATYDGTTWFSIWTAGSALTGAGTVFYTFGPGMGAASSGAGNETENATIPLYRDMRVVLTVASADGANNMDTAAYLHIGS